MIRIAFDIGGTFTDFVLHDADRNVVRFGKALTTPRNLEQAVLEGVDAILAAHAATSAAVASVLHATTIATNAILERKGARTALITTAGFRDVDRDHASQRCFHPSCGPTMVDQRVSA